MESKVWTYFVNSIADVSVFFIQKLLNINIVCVLCISGFHLLNKIWDISPNNCESKLSEHWNRTSPHYIL